MTSELGERGQALWAELVTDQTPLDEKALVTEACRIADRLERLDQILRGDLDTWLEISTSFDGRTIYVTMGNTLSEARQHALVLKALLAEIRVLAGNRPASKGVSGLAAIAAELPAGVADLSAARARRP